MRTQKSGEENAVKKEPWPKPPLKLGTRTQKLEGEDSNREDPEEPDKPKDEESDLRENVKPDQESLEEMNIDFHEIKIDQRVVTIVILKFSPEQLKVADFNHRTLLTKLTGKKEEEIPLSTEYTASQAMASGLFPEAQCIAGGIYYDYKDPQDKTIKDNKISDGLVVFALKDPLLDLISGFWLSKDENQIMDKGGLFLLPWSGPVEIVRRRNLDSSFAFELKTEENGTKLCIEGDCMEPIQWVQKYRFMVQSNILLVKDGMPDNYINDKALAARTTLAFSEPDELSFVLAYEAGKSGDGYGLTIQEFGDYLAQTLRVKHAIHFDGGPSTQMACVTPDSKVQVFKGSYNPNTMPQLFVIERKKVVVASL